MRGLLAVLLACVVSVRAQQGAPATDSSAKHPFGAKDWSALRSARAIAVSPQGTILYNVSYGGDKGPTRNEWWTIGADGTHAAKLDLSDDFSPMGFTPDGSKLYGAFKVNKQRQLAIFPISGHKAAAVPSTLCCCPAA